MKKEELDKLLNECKNLAEQAEPFQKKVKAKHSRLKRLIIGDGGQKNTPPYTQKPSMERSKSAPPIGELRFRDLSKKNVWTKIDPELLRQNKKEAEEETNINDELYDILDKSYSKIGGHAEFKKPSDLPSNYTGWAAIDVDDDPGPDALRVWRIDPQGNIKLTAGGSDGSPMGKDVFLRKTVEMLNTPGTYAEMSDAIAHVMIARYSVPSVNDEEFVRKLLQGKQIKWIGASPTGKYAGYNGWYNRDIGGTSHNKIILGYPAGYTPEKKNINIKEAVNLEKTPNLETKKLYVFDFDDTLVKSNSKVYLVNKEGERTVFTPELFAAYEEVEGDTFNFDEFDQVIDPKPITNMINKLRKAIERNDSVVLTARAPAAYDAISKTLSEYNVAPTDIVLLGSPNPSKKTDYIAKMIDKNNYTYVEYYDDSKRNIDAAMGLKNKFPNVELNLYCVIYGVPIPVLRYKPKSDTPLKEGLFDGWFGAPPKSAKYTDHNKAAKYTDYNKAYNGIYVGGAPISGGKLMNNVANNPDFKIIYIMSKQVANLIDSTGKPDNIITRYAIEDTLNPTEEEKAKLKMAGKQAQLYISRNPESGVLFTCSQGLNRSAAAACITMLELGLSPDQAVENVENARGSKTLTLNGPPQRHAGFVPIINSVAFKTEKSLPA